jgi:DNA repair exonuclease SbcCD ATPase subunit
MKTKFTILFLIFAFVFGNCKPNSKSQIQQWESNQKEFAEATTTYPNFKALLDAKMNNAKAIWGEAEKLTNEEEKVQKMKEANEKLNELLNQFTQIKYKLEGILKSIDKIDDKKLNSKKDKIRDDAIEEGQKAIALVKEKMSAAAPTNDEEAVAVTKECISILISAQGTLDRAIKAIKK